MYPVQRWLLLPLFAGFLLSLALHRRLWPCWFALRTARGVAVAVWVLVLHAVVERMDSDSSTGVYTGGRSCGRHLCLWPMALLAGSLLHSLLAAAWALRRADRPPTAPTWLYSWARRDIGFRETITANRRAVMAACASDAGSLTLLAGSLCLLTIPTFVIIYATLPAFAMLAIGAGSRVRGLITARLTRSFQDASPKERAIRARREFAQILAGGRPPATTLAAVVLSVLPLCAAVCLCFFACAVPLLTLRADAKEWRFRPEVYRTVVGLFAANAAAQLTWFAWFYLWPPARALLAERRKIRSDSSGRADASLLVAVNRWIIKQTFQY